LDFNGIRLGPNILEDIVAVSISMLRDRILSADGISEKDISVACTALEWQFKNANDIKRPHLVEEFFRDGLPKPSDISVADHFLYCMFLFVIKISVLFHFLQRVEFIPGCKNTT